MLPEYTRTDKEGLPCPAVYKLAHTLYRGKT